MDLNEILTIAVKARGSDVHIKTGLPPIVRIDGKLHPIPNAQRLGPDMVASMAMMMMNDRQKRIFEENSEVDMAYAVPGLGRFRVSCYRQRGTLAMVFRAISMKIPTMDELNLPPVLRKLCLEERGLILVTGTTGSGKSSTLAAMIDHINNSRTCNVITIEDPVEFLHRDNKSIISQREVGTDTPNFSSALKGALRQDPDVILVGEMRDYETIRTAMTAAETGHMVLSTLHTRGAANTVDRIIDIFPPSQQQQIRVQLAYLLQVVISQQLLPTVEGGLVPAFEVMVVTNAVRNLIRDAKLPQIDSVIATSAAEGMVSMDASITELYRQGRVTAETAISFAMNPDLMAKRL